MKLMIDISDSTYEAIMARDWKNAGWLFGEELKAIHDGTPIMEHNGRMDALVQEPCPNAISRSDMLDAVGHGTTYTSEELQIIIKGMPPVKPQEPNTGHWITKPHIYGVAFCSECDFELRIDDTKYCPNCGAKMESQERNDEE